MIWINCREVLTGKKEQKKVLFCLFLSLLLFFLLCFVWKYTIDRQDFWKDEPFITREYCFDESQRCTIYAKVNIKQSYAQFIYKLLLDKKCPKSECTYSWLFQIFMKNIGIKRHTHKCFIFLSLSLSLTLFF